MVIRKSVWKQYFEDVEVDLPKEPVYWFEFGYRYA